MANYVIDYFEIPAADASKTSAFLTRAFGFGALAYGDQYIEVRDGGVLGGINADKSDRPAAPMIGIRTDDIADAGTSITAAGGTVTRPVYDYPGGKRLFFREPGGAELMVYQPND